MTWGKNKEEALELIKNADIVHFHHWFDLKFNPFLIDFNKICKLSCKFLRHFHSNRYFLNKTEIRFAELIEKDTIPKIVIPHCPERTFLNFPVVPNIMPIFDKEYLPKKVNNKRVKVLFSASQGRSMYEYRWETKGYEEVSKKLKELSSQYDFEYVEVFGKTFKEAMKMKSECDIVVGDIVTGSYHLTELEGLSLGKPVLTWLDGRSVMTFMNTFKTQDVPFVNVNLENLEEVLKELVKDRELQKNIGNYSRSWIEEYYREEILIEEFTKIYFEILKKGTLAARKNSENFQGAKEFLYNRLYDINWEQRCKERKD